MNCKSLLCTLLVFCALFSGTAIAADKIIEWKFEGNLIDTSGSGLHANAYPNTSAIMYDDGVSGQALWVYDANECAYLTGIDTSVLPVLADDTWSVNLWVYPTETPKDWRIAWCLGQKPSSSSHSSRALYSSNKSGLGMITFVDPKDPVEPYIVSFIPWDVNQWQMLTTTYDGSIVRVYKNGVLIAMRDQTFFDAPGEVRVPSNPWSGSNFFIGRFDEFTVWRGVLSSADILDLIIPGAIPAVELNQQVVYYQMGDTTSSAIPDHSGQANDGGLYGYTSPITNWVADGFRGDALLFDGGQKIDLPVSISQPVNYTVSFWFKSGQQPHYSAFYSERKMYPDPDGTQLIIRANNDELQVFSKNRDYHTLFSVSGDASAYLDGETWNHLAVVADGEAAQASLYVNGQLLASGLYEQSSHKTTTLNAAVGYSWADDGFIGEWGSSYLDEVKIWNGALTPSQIQAIAAHSNFGNDLKVDGEDLAFMSGDWQLNYQTSPGSILVADDMEGTLDSWSVYSGFYSGTGTISQTVNAYAGSGALQWDYELPASSDPNNYTNILFDFGETKDLSNYDEVSLWLYRHEGNTPEDLVYLKFIDADMDVKAESWMMGDNSAVEPVQEWAEWKIDPNSLIDPNGVGTADRSDLTDIRYLLIGAGSWDRTDARTGTIDIDEVQFILNPVCSGRPAADTNFDCKVDIDDLLMIVEEWLYGME